MWQVKMIRYRWGLLKTLEYINQKKPDVQLTASVLRSLNIFEKYLISQDSIKFLSYDWKSKCMYFIQFLKFSINR